MNNSQHDADAENTSSKDGGTAGADTIDSFHARDEPNTTEPTQDSLTCLDRSTAADEVTVDTATATPTASAIATTTSSTTATPVAGASATNARPNTKSTTSPDSTSGDGKDDDDDDDDDETYDGSDVDSTDTSSQSSSTRKQPHTAASTAAPANCSESSSSSQKRDISDAQASSTATAATGAAPRHYRCKICDMRFTKRSALQRHQRIIHNKKRELKFVCARCTYRTDRRFNLERHLRRHAREDEEASLEARYRMRQDAAQAAQTGSRPVMPQPQPVVAVGGNGSLRVMPNNHLVPVNAMPSSNHHMLPVTNAQPAGVVVTPMNNTPSALAPNAAGPRMQTPSAQGDAPSSAFTQQGQMKAALAPANGFAVAPSPATGPRPHLNGVAAGAFPAGTFAAQVQQQHPMGYPRPQLQPHPQYMMSHFLPGQQHTMPYQTIVPPGFQATRFPPAISLSQPALSLAQGNARRLATQQKQNDSTGGPQAAFSQPQPPYMAWQQPGQMFHPYSTYSSAKAQAGQPPSSRYQEKAPAPQLQYASMAQQQYYPAFTVAYPGFPPAANQHVSGLPSQQPPQQLNHQPAFFVPTPLRPGTEQTNDMNVNTT